MLVTHQVQYLPRADKIVFVQEGTAIQGTYSQLENEGLLVNIQHHNSNLHCHNEPFSDSTQSDISNDLSVRHICKMTKKTKLMVLCHGICTGSFLGLVSACSTYWLSCLFYAIIQGKDIFCHVQSI
jgi:hypothetical protein